MKIRTKNHTVSLGRSVEIYLRGERPHVYVEWVREGFTLHRRAFRCPGKEAAAWEDYATDEQLILREVRAIRASLERHERTPHS